MSMREQLHHEIITGIAKATGYTYEPHHISKPPSVEMGDFAIPLFLAAKEIGENPIALAQRVASEITSPFFARVQAVGPYVNFFINPQTVNRDIIVGTLRARELGMHDAYQGKRVMIEYFSPNTNKPMTVGHVRNLLLGSSLARLYEKARARVIRATLFNDRGIAICKSMVAYDLFGKEKTPESENMKPDQFVGSYYVKFGREAEDDPKYDLMAKEYLVLWERGDKKIRALWKKMNGWVYKGFLQTLNKLQEGDFDEVYYESDFYDKAKDIVMRHIGNGVIKQGETGEIYADLESQGLPNKILLRSDGTSLYITQDLYLAALKEKKKLDRSLYVVADEQNLQIKQLFAILESLEASRDKYVHVSYGMMRLPEGKIKSREGFGRALADALIDEVEALARVEIAKRQENLSEKQISNIAHALMHAAIKFNILYVDAKKEMVFDPAEAVNFTGKTGPYVQYTVVRLNSILKQAKLDTKALYELLTHDVERALIADIEEYTAVLTRALEEHNPALVAQYAYELAQRANQMYHTLPVLKADPEVQKARVGLISAVAKVLTDALEVLGISVPEAM